MFKLNRKVEYALIALKHMIHKHPGELSTAKEIAENYGCSFDTIARVLQIMAQKNWLQSSQGAAGGYLIIKDLANVSFYQLSEALVGPMKLVRCISSSSCKIQNHCNIVSPVHTLNQHLTEVYKGLSVQKILFETPFTNIKKSQQQPLKYPRSINKDNFALTPDQPTSAKSKLNNNENDAPKPLMEPANYKNISRSIEKELEL